MHLHEAIGVVHALIIAAMAVTVVVVLSVIGACAIIGYMYHINRWVGASACISACFVVDLTLASLSA